jgi:type II secretory pathway pseudopilin PulG
MFFRKVIDTNKNNYTNESGLMLIESLAATAIIAMIAVGLLSGMSIASKSDFIITKASKAEALARSQMEYIKSSDYIDYSVPGHGNYELLTVPDSYTVEMNCSPVSLSTGQTLNPDEDEGIQLINIIVSYDGEQAATLKGYKIDR